MWPSLTDSRGHPLSAFPDRHLMPVIPRFVKDFRYLARRAPGSRRPVGAPPLRFIRQTGLPEANGDLEDELPKLRKQSPPSVAFAFGGEEWRPPCPVPCEVVEETRLTLRAPQEGLERPGVFGWEVGRVVRPE